MDALSKVDSLQGFVESRASARQVTGAGAHEYEQRGCAQADAPAAVTLTVVQPFEVRASCTAAARCCAYIPAPAVHCTLILHCLE